VRSEKSADIVFLNSKVITVDKDESIAEAVGVRDGRIVHVGNSKSVKPFTNEKTCIINLEGRTMLPGFIDAHTHVELIAENLVLAVSVHIPPLESVEEILTRIRGKVNQTRKGEWIIGQGRGMGNIQPLPSKRDLDAIAPEHPVVLRSSMHRYMLNSMALRLAGVTKDTPNPPGGEIDKDQETGEPTGILKECYQILPIPPYPYMKVKEALREVFHMFVKYGVTTIYDLPATSSSIRAYQELLRNDELPLRLQLSITINDSAGTQKIAELGCLKDLGFQTGFGDNRLKLGAIKVFVDGEGDTAAFYDPPGQSKHWRGLLKLTQEELSTIVKTAHRVGLQVWMHAIGDKALDMALDAVETALDELPRENHRHRIEHAGIRSCTLEHLGRMKKMEVIPVPTPAWIYPTINIQRDRKVYRYRSIIEHGLSPPGNSDSAGSMPESINPLFGIWCVVARKTESGELLCPEEKISVMDAIRLYTANSAYAGFEEEIKGSIEVGKLADLIVLSADPLSCKTDEIKNITVEMTIVGGKIVYVRRKGVFSESSTC
jgi:hypothetical protein